MPFNDIFGGNTIYPADPTYLSLALSADITLQWPLEQNISDAEPPLAKIIDVTPAGAGLTITLPDARNGSTGYVTTFYNAGADTFTVEDSTGATVLTVASGEAWNTYLRDTSTAAGLWRIFEMGAGTSTANAATLAGAGLEADGTTLNEEMVTSNHAVNYTLVDGDRANIQAWTGGVGEFTLPDPATVGAGWFAPIKNNGTGSLTILPTAGAVDGGASMILATLESAFFVSDGTNFYTVGLGQEVNSVFDFTSIDVAGSGDFTLTGSQLNRVAYEFTGLLTGNRNIIVPASVQQYWVENATTGAFALVVKTVGVAGVTVAQGERAILYCDGTSVVLAQTAGAITFADGSAAAPSITFTNNNATGLFNAAGVLGFVTGGVSRGTLDTTGHWDLTTPDSGTGPTLGIAKLFATSAIRTTSSIGDSSTAPSIHIQSEGFAILSLTADGTLGTDDFALQQNHVNKEVSLISRSAAAINFVMTSVNVLQLNTPGVSEVVIGTASANNVRFNNTTSTTIGAAGGADALPATPLGYLTWNVNGASIKVPYYNP